MGIARTLEWDKIIVRKCPSYMQVQDKCAHVLFCQHEGQGETLKHTINFMEEWLTDAETNLDLLDCIAEYAHSRGASTMIDICEGLGPQFMQMAHDQDAIG
jgi:hypothetical protein